MRPSITVFYGINLDDEHGDKFDYDPDDSAAIVRGSPAWLVYAGEQVDGVEPIGWGYLGDYTRRALAVQGTAIYGGNYAAVELKRDLFKTTPDTQKLTDYCDRWGLPLGPIGWWAVPVYG